MGMESVVVAHEVRWILQNLFRPDQTPVVNVVAAALVVFSIVPIYLAQRLSGVSSETATAAR